VGGTWFVLAGFVVASAGSISASGAPLLIAVLAASAASVLYSYLTSRKLDGLEPSTATVEDDRG